MDNLIQDTPIEEKPADESNEESNEVVSESVKAFLGEETPEKPEEDEKEQDILTSEEKPQEDTVSEVETPKEPEVPLEEIVEEVRTKTKEETKQEILKALGMTEQEKEVAEEAGYKFPWEQRGDDAPKDWKEVVEASIDYQEYKKKEIQDQQSEAQRQELLVMQEREAQINTEWDSELAYLREEKLIPEIAPDIQAKINEGKVLTKADRTDPGLKAQADLFEKMYEVSLEREKNGLHPITDVVHIFSRYYKPIRPAGMNAPVSGGSIPTAGEEEDISYDKLHNAQSFEELIG